MRLILLLLLLFPVASWSSTCLIFVHGKQTDTSTFTSYSAARNYWTKGSNDFIRTATKNFQNPYYVVGYNGTRPYYESQTAGEVTAEILRATSGQADDGGNSCGAATNYFVVAHSMGGTVMDFILGNARTSDPNYNFGGNRFDLVASQINLVFALSGAHRGSEGADAVCGNGGFFCNFIGGFIQDCDAATYWLRSSNDVQVRQYSGAPYKNVWLTAGYEAIFGASACLSGEDDGVVQYASMFACSGSATAGYNNSNVCGNGSKQESSGFRNLDAAHENHGDIKDASDSDTRKQVPDGIWTCSGSTCSPNTTVQSSMTTAEFISILY